MTEKKNTSVTRVSDEIFKAAIEVAKTMSKDMPEHKSARELADATEIPFGAALSAVRLARKAIARDIAFKAAKEAVCIAFKAGKKGDDLRRVALSAAGEGAILLSANAIEAAVAKGRDIVEREERIAAATERFARERARVAANNGAGARYKTGKTARKKEKQGR